MAIVKNDYLEIRTVDGEKRLFGKCGFQTMSQKTDKYTMANMAAIERAYDEGLLTDINGNPVTPETGDAVIVQYSRITKVKGGTAIEQVSSIQSLSGNAVTVPEPKAADSADDNPLS